MNTNIVKIYCASCCKVISKPGWASLNLDSTGRAVCEDCFEKDRVDKVQQGMYYAPSTTITSGSDSTACETQTVPKRKTYKCHGCGLEMTSIYSMDKQGRPWCGLCTEYNPKCADLDLSKYAEGEEDGDLRKPYYQNKHDEGKPDYTLLPWKALAEVAKVQAYGVVKYGKGKWREVPDGFNRYIASAFRHLSVVIAGEERDGESGLLHIAQAATNILYALEMYEANETAG